MMKTIRPLFTGIALFFITVLAAQDRGISLFSNKQVYTGRNPSIPFPKEYMVGLPEIAGDLIRETGKGPWLVDRADGDKDLSLASGWAGLEGKNYFIEGDWKIRTLFLGKKWKNWQLGFSHEWEGHSHIRFNKDLVGLLGFGNYGYLKVEPRAGSQALDLRPEGDHSIFQALTLQSAWLREKWSVGAAIRYIGGLQDFHTDIRRLNADIRDPLTINMEEDWTLYSADLLETFSPDSIRLDSPESPGLGRHPGFAFSMGFQYKTPRWMAALQVKDLGSIRWKNGNQFSRSGNTVYQGIEGIDFLNLDENIFNQIRDTIRSLANVERTAVKYTTRFQASLQGENQFYFSERWTAGLAAGYTFHREYWYFMAGGVYRPIHFWSFGGQLSFDSRKDWNLGILTALELGAFNLFFTTDHLPALWNLKQADRFQARIGMALMWN